MLTLTLNISLNNMDGLVVGRKKNSKIPKWQIEFVDTEDRQDHGRQNKEGKHRTHKLYGFQSEIERATITF